MHNTKVFFLFLDERNNRLGKTRVTNCQSPLSPTQFFNFCDSLATPRQAKEVQIFHF